MRACILTYSQAWGGTEIHTAALAGRLAERGHRVTVVSIGHSVFARLEPKRNRRFSLLGFDSAGTGRVLRPLLWLRLFRDLDCDLCVVAKSDVFSGSAFVEFLARRVFGNLVTIEYLTPPALSQRSSARHLGGLLPGLGLWWYRQLFRVHARSLAPHRIVAISEAIRTQLVQDYRFPANKVVTIRLGIDAGRYRPDSARRSAVCAAWGVPKDAVMLGAVARLANGHKGHDISVRCFARLLAERPRQPLWLVLVGEGPDRDALLRLAAELGIAGRVILPGPTDRPWEAHAGIDLFLMPSRFEGLGLSLLEAMAAETCCIATAVGGIPEILSDPGLGWLVPPDDEDAFFLAVRDAVNTPAAERREIGRRARAHVVRSFDGDAQLSRLAELLESEARRSPTRAARNRAPAP